MGSILSTKQATPSEKVHSVDGNGAAARTKTLRVAIIGGGPGGLATAIALSKIPNVKAHIYEKDAVLREVGAGINIGPNSWNVLGLLGVADSLVSGHQCNVVLNMNGRTGEQLFRMDRPGDPEWPHGAWKSRPTIRTQRTALQSALLAHVPAGTIQLSKKLARMTDLGETVELTFVDGTVVTADLVVGADGIRSVVRDSAWPDYEISFTGTTIWRALLPLAELQALDERFALTGWWHMPSSHVYFSPVGEGLGEIAARETTQAEAGAKETERKVVWGVPVANAHVEGHFGEYLAPIRAALGKVATGGWREFAAFAGPELERLTAWGDKVVLVGDASHALSGAFGSGAGFAMEDGWVLAQALRHVGNDVGQALPLFDRVRWPYYHRMYEHLADAAAQRAAKLRALDEQATGAGAGGDGDGGGDREAEEVKIKVIREGKDMSWIYQNDIGQVWAQAIGQSAQ